MTDEYTNDVDAEEYDIGDDETVIALALATQEGELYAYTGPNTTDFPVKFGGVTTDGVLSINSHARRLTSQLAGTVYFTRPLDSDDGQVLSDLVDDLDGERDTDAILDVVDEYLERIDADDGSADDA